ncbi:hypothetical protein YA0089_18995 [Pseudomonas viridiflava]|uniref:hypothetical protein n=1 Tax=Pseudomonas viridiflava TaxID=33069 RepID=UPI0018E5E00D|nr:hypothetical protein [Pseudomonas viridiflava]MBI6725695.1 hypothetical protein [Pseudomonas viridiflava]
MNTVNKVKSSLATALMLIAICALSAPANAGWITKPIKEPAMRWAIAKGGLPLAQRTDDTPAKTDKFDKMKDHITKYPWMADKAIEAMEDALRHDAVKQRLNRGTIEAVRTNLTADIKQWSRDGAKEVKKRYFDSMETQTGSKIGEEQRDLIWKELNSKGEGVMNKQVTYYKTTNFDRKKEQLVREWENHNHMRWPRESNGWPYPVGKIISDENYGKATWWNIIPEVTGSPKPITDGPYRSEAAILLHTIQANIQLDDEAKK